MTKISNMVDISETDTDMTLYMKYVKNATKIQKYKVSHLEHLTFVVGIIQGKDF